MSFATPPAEKGTSTSSWQAPPIRDEGAEVRPVLGPPDEVAVRWMGLEQDGRAHDSGPVDQHVDAVTVQERAGRRQKRQRQLAVVGTMQLLGMGDKIFLHIVQVLVDRGQGGELLPELLEERTHSRGSDIADEPFVSVPCVTLELPQAPVGGFHVRLEDLAVFPDRLLHRCGQRLVLHGGQRLTMWRGCEGQASWTVQHREPPGPGGFLEARYLFALLGPEVLHDA